MRLAAAQKDGDEAALSISECVYLGVAPSARTPDSLLFSPLFPPEAERAPSHG